MITEGALHVNSQKIQLQENEWKTYNANSYGAKLEFSFSNLVRTANNWDKVTKVQAYIQTIHGTIYTVFEGQAKKEHVYNSSDDPDSLVLSFSGNGNDGQQQFSIQLKEEFSQIAVVLRVFRSTELKSSNGSILNLTGIKTIIPGRSEYGLINRNEVIRYRFNSDKAHSQSSDMYLIIYQVASHADIVPEYQIEPEKHFSSPINYVHSVPMDFKLSASYKVFSLKESIGSEFIISISFQETSSTERITPGVLRFEMKIAQVSIKHYLVNSFTSMYLLNNEVALYTEEEDSTKIILVDLKQEQGHIKISVNSKEYPEKFTQVNSDRNLPVHFLNKNTLYVNNKEQPLLKIEVDNNHTEAFFGIKKTIMPPSFEAFQKDLLEKKSTKLEYQLIEVTPNGVLFRFKIIELSNNYIQLAESMIVEYHAYLADTEEAIFAAEEYREVLEEHQPAEIQIQSHKCDSIKCPDVEYIEAQFNLTPNKQTTPRDHVFIQVKAVMRFPVQIRGFEFRNREWAIFYTRMKVHIDEEITNIIDEGNKEPPVVVDPPKTDTNFVLVILLTLLTAAVVFVVFFIIKRIVLKKKLIQIPEDKGSNVRQTSNFVEFNNE